MGEVCYGNGGFTHQIGSIHIVVEQAVEEYTTRQYQQDGGIGGDGFPFAADYIIFFTDMKGFFALYRSLYPPFQ